MIFVGLVRISFWLIDEGAGATSRSRAGYHTFRGR